MLIFFLFSINLIPLFNISESMLKLTTNANQPHFAQELSAVESKFHSHASTLIQDWPYSQPHSQRLHQAMYFVRFLPEMLVERDGLAHTMNLTYLAVMSAKTIKWHNKLVSHVIDTIQVLLKPTHLIWKRFPAKVFLWLWKQLLLVLTSQFSMQSLLIEWLLQLNPQQPHQCTSQLLQLW